MNYYAAPMEGLTDRVWRQAHQKWFGPAGNADRYYAPFISPCLLYTSPSPRDCS